MIKQEKNYLIITLALGMALNFGCSSEPKKRQKANPGQASGEVDAHSAMKQGIISMNLLTSLPSGIDQVRVLLTNTETPVSGPQSQSYVFSNLTSFEIGALKPATYLLNLDFIESKTGKVVIQSEGSVTVQAGKTTKTILYEGKDASSTGKLIIEIRDNISQSPKMCTTEAKLPACIKDGDAYKVQSFTKDQNCTWQPANVTEVDASFCKPLPKAPEEEAVECPAVIYTVCFKVGETYARGNLDGCHRGGPAMATTVDDSFCKDLPKLPR